MSLKYEVVFNNQYIERCLCYLRHNQNHRVNAPSNVWEDGDMIWRQYGIQHRLNGPAIEYADGYKEWYKHGLLHRDDGPAVEWANGAKEWWITEKEYTKEDYESKIRSTQIQE